MQLQKSALQSDLRGIQIILFSVHPPPVEASLHAGAGRLPRADRSRSPLCRSRLRRVLSGDRTRVARCQRRLHRKTCDGNYFFKKYFFEF